MFDAFAVIVACQKNQIFIILAVLRLRVTNGSFFHPRDLAPGQPSSEETSQQWRAVGDTLSDLTGLRIEPYVSRTVVEAF